MKPSLVTGANGFLGRRLVEMLRARGHSVRALVRRPDAALSATGAEVVIGSLESRLSLLDACRDCDTVFHCAAKAGMGGEWRDYHVPNVEGTQNLLEAARHHRVAKFVFTSSPSVIFQYPGCSGSDESKPYPENFLNHYAETKALSEKAVLQANGWGGMATTALRPHLIWGPGDPHLVPRLLDRARQGKLVRVGAGQNRVDLTHIDNAAWAHVLAGEKLTSEGSLAGKAYFISDGEPVKLWDWIGSLLSELGLPSASRSISTPLAFNLGSLIEWGHKTFRLQGEPRLTRFIAYQLGLPHFYNIEAARRDLGYAPSIEPAQALREYVEHLRA